MELSKEETEKYRELWNKVDFTKIDEEKLEKESMQLAVILATLYYHTKGIMPNEDDVKEKAEEIHMCLVLEKMRREGLIKINYAEDKKTIIGITVTEKGKQEALGLLFEKYCQKLLGDVNEDR